VHRACLSYPNVVSIMLYAVYQAYRVYREAHTDEGLSGVNG
jgi:hypothetical protein